MKFEKRDILLIVGLLLVMIGLMPFMAPVYAALIVIILYFGIKIYVGKKKQSIQREIGEGICIECGAQISNNRCPNCDKIKE